MLLGSGHGKNNYPDIYLGKVGALHWTYDCGCGAVDDCPNDDNKR